MAIQEQGGGGEVVPEEKNSQQEEDSKQLKAMADKFNAEEQRILQEHMLKNLDATSGKDEKNNKAEDEIMHRAELNSGINTAYEDRVSYQRTRRQKLEDIKKQNPKASDAELETQLVEFWGMPAELSDEELEDRYYVQGSEARKQWEASRKKGKPARKTF